MIGGGALAVAGLMCWFSANDTQNQIDTAPTKTSKDLQNLLSLEHQGDSYAAAGNVLFIGGTVIGLAAGFLYWRDHRSDHRVARITPTVMPHGAGISLQLGGAP
jgi:hypothetical protein